MSRVRADIDNWQRMPAGEGYRLLEPGELVKSGDEYYWQGKWVNSTHRGIMKNWMNPRRRKENA